ITVEVFFFKYTDLLLETLSSTIPLNIEYFYCSYVIVYIDLSTCAAQLRQPWLTLHRCAYEVIFHNHGHSLYLRVHDVVKEHLVEKYILLKVNQAWINHQTSMAAIHGILLYMDLVYVKHADIETDHWPMQTPTPNCNILSIVPDEYIRT
uniref:Cullin N-terminal domain-containing protein n=1 Tax=Glossina palpalis gambiensis TaxID=67801 RepID=A0A1B0BDY9_9MUSC